MIFGKYINRYYLKHAPTLLLGIAALILVDYMQLIIPELYRMLINGVNSGQVLVAGAPAAFTKEVLLQNICLPMVGIVACMVVGRFLWRVCFFGAAIRVETELRNRMFDHSKDLSQAYYQVNKVGNLMSLYTNDLETIQHTIFEVLNKYLKERNSSNLFYYSDELRSFVRTFERVGKGSNDSTRTNRDKLRYELLVLEFILALLQRVHMNKSPLLETRSTIVSIEAALKTYSDLIDGDLDDDSLDSRLSVLNTEWDNRQKAIASMAGTFIVILDTIVEAGTRLAHPIRPVEIRLENTYSASLLENLVLSEIEFNRQQSEGSTDYAFKILGPLDEDSARTLAEYLRMGVQLNFPNGPSNEMLSWCENQYQNFINTKTDDQEDDE